MYKLEYFLYSISNGQFLNFDVTILHIVFHPIFKREVYFRTYRENEARATHTANQTISSISREAEWSFRGRPRSPSESAQETKQNRSHINHLSQFRGRKDRLRSKSFHWGSVVGCATSQLRAVRCETGDLRGTKTRNTPLVGTI